MHVAEAQERAHLLRPFLGSLPQGDDVRFSLSFFFLRAGRLGIRDMCVPVHTPRSWSARGRMRGDPCGVWKKSPSAGGRRTAGGAKGGKTTGPTTLSTAAIRRRIHGNIEHVHRGPLVGCTSTGLFLSLPRPSLLLPQTSGCSLHARHSGPRTKISSSTRGYVKRTTSHRRPSCPQQLAPRRPRARRVNVRATSLPKSLYLIANLIAIAIPIPGRGLYLSYC